MDILEMIDGCKHDDALAQASLYNLLSPNMLAVCYRYASTREDAEDMLQEGFIKVFTMIDAFEFKGSFEGWVRRIMVNTCINILKRNKKFGEQVALEEAFGEPVKSDVISSLLQKKEVIEFIRSMPVGYRTVLNLYAIEGYSHKEIAEMLDIEEATSRSQYFKAKNLLMRTLLKENVIGRSEQSGQLAFN